MSKFAKNPLSLALLLTAIGGLASMEVNASEPNTLIAVHVVELNNNKNNYGAYDPIYNEYRLIREETGKKKRIAQRSRAKFLYLKPGSYCFYSTNYLQYEIVKIANPACFRVAEDGITNAGTWVIGLKIAGGNTYAVLVDMKKNYAEIESVAEVTGSTPAIMTLPVEK